jgi:putative spermidine/putrescine transport system ATP-binding protein
MKETVMLNLQGVSKRYGNVQALKPLNLAVREGEMLALLGPSGCGKTTTLRIVAGFETPDTGSVLIAAKDVTDTPPNKRTIGMVFQNYSLFPHMRVAENVAFGLKVRGVSRHEIDKRVQAMLDRVRLGKFADREIHQLSGGQQQRVALARALVTNPSVLLLDEPLGALDKNLRERMQFELRELQRQFGITSILVTHDQEEALTMSDRIAVMSEGEVLQIGVPTDVYERPRSTFVSEFLGTSNIVHGTVLREAQPGLWAVEFKLGAAPEGLVASKERLTPGDQIKLAIRPERLCIGEASVSPMKATIKDLVFRGSYFAYEMFISGSDVPVFMHSPSRVAASGDNIVHLGWQPEHAIVLTQ